MSRLSNRILYPSIAIAVFIAVPCSAATITAKSCSQTDVSAALSTAAIGDTVQVPPGSCSWSGLSIGKAIHLKGAGTGQTNITITGELTVTKQSVGVLRVSDFSFSRQGSGSATIGIRATGSWNNEPVVFDNNAFTVTDATLFRVESPGGFIFSRNNVNAGWDDIIFQLKDNGGAVSWQTADTLGNRDTTGKRNHYIEDNTIYGGTNTTVDCDDGARCVYRHNTVTYSGFGSHGYATSPVGVRHFEIYNNTWLYPTSGCSTQFANQNWLARLRGGTGVVFNNTMPDIAAACGWGDKPEVRLDLRGAEDVRPQGSCSQTTYPVPRQIGQNHNGANYFTDPVYIWGNSKTPTLGLGWGWGNPCGFNWDTFVKPGRDYVMGGAKPGYAPYTYPHPLAQVSSKPGSLAAPSNLQIVQ
ncbi:MAG: hypothetical protein U9Q81_22770 [Pseudomonadota bacterium]|nr:hypothetical protein [Pseudomonadota bacterium]